MSTSKKPVRINLYISDVNEAFPNEKENRQEFIEFCETNDMPIPDESKMEDEIYDYLCMINSDNYESLMNDIKEYEMAHGKEIYIIEASVNGWSGTRVGYALAIGLRDALTKGEGDKTFYIEDHQVKVESTHHDGTNYTHIKKLSELGKKYYSNHYENVNSTDFELYKHLFTSNRLSKEVDMFKKIYGY